MHAKDKFLGQLRQRLDEKGMLNEEELLERPVLVKCDECGDRFSSHDPDEVEYWSYDHADTGDLSYTFIVYAQPSVVTEIEATVKIET